MIGFQGRFIHKNLMMIAKVAITFIATGLQELFLSLSDDVPSFKDHGCGRSWCVHQERHHHEDGILRHVHLQHGHLRQS